MKPTYLCPVLFLLLTLVCCSQVKDDEKYEELLNKIKSSNFESSEEILYTLINKSSDKHIQDYYYILDSLQIENNNKIFNKLNHKEISKNSTIDHGKYTVGLVWGQKEVPAELTVNLNKRIELLEEYLTKFPNGKYYFYFAEKLLFTYSKKDKIKVIQVANILLNAPTPVYKFYGNLYLATIYHEDQLFHEALKYYKNIISAEEDSVKASAFYLYSADCYYNINEYKQALDCLQKSIIAENKLPKPIVSNLAKEWIKIYKKSQNDPKSIKQKLVYFN